VQQKNQNTCQTLDAFLQCIEIFVEERKKQFFGVDDYTLSDEIAFITSKDLSTITSGATRPAKAFRSPFVGESIEQVGDWFVKNIVPSNGYTRRAFVVMDSQTVEDNTCIVVRATVDEVESFRCDFDVAQLQINSLEFGSEGMREGVRALFLETGEVMTKEKFYFALQGWLYIEDGKQKTKEA
jgi:hypothetical protein